MRPLPKTTEAVYVSRYGRLWDAPHRHHRQRRHARDAVQAASAVTLAKRPGRDARNQDLE